METELLIPIEVVCKNHNTDPELILSFQECGLIEIIRVEERYFVHPEKLNILEKFLRLNGELGINLEGLEVVSHLLEKLDHMQQEIQELKNKIQFHTKT
jgi:hypothetical protein